LPAGLRGVAKQDADSQRAVVEGAFETPTNAFKQLRSARAVIGESRQGGHAAAHQSLGWHPSNFGHTRQGP
jgi:hypothetical protein